MNEEVSREAIDTGKQVGKVVIRKALQLDAKGLSKLIQLMKTAPKKVMEKLLTVLKLVLLHMIGVSIHINDP